MIYSQARSVNTYQYEFIRYVNLEVDGVSKSTARWRTYLDRAQEKYYSFHLELIY